MTFTVISTWDFSRTGIEAAAKQLESSGSALDAVEAGIRVVEEDPTVTSVGYGGLPNANGQLELDAALMTSDGQQGAIMGVPGLRSAIPAARHVLQQSPHAILCAQGAQHFAITHGVTSYHNDTNKLLTPHARKRYDDFLSGKDDVAGLNNAGDEDNNGDGDENDDEDGDRGGEEMGHTDTVGMIALDGKGDLVVGCATSGMQFKHAGRVGDAPIFGAGLFADEYGGAAATGDGDHMLRFCLSFLVVERLRHGDDPTTATRHAIRRLSDKQPTCQAAVIALDPDGGVGAAATHDGFIALVHREHQTHLQRLQVPGASSTRWKHSCV